jgi:hypothetical protein
MSKIAITIEFTEAEFKRMIKEAECKITDEAKFVEIINGKKFAKELARDMKDMWKQSNENSGDMESVLQCLGLDECIEERIY